MADAYDKAVRKLAAWHARGARPRVTVYAVPDPQRREVRLIEVSNAFPDTAPPEPVIIGPTRDFPYASGTLSVTTAAFRLIKAGRLPLPRDWDFASCKKVWPSDQG